MAEQDRQALATEVIELGEQLFALALEGRASQQSGDDTTSEAFPMAEIEAASSEFFTALRLLMYLEQSTTAFLLQAQTRER
jgi:hypothetical protein